MEQVPGQAVAQLHPPVSCSSAVAVSGWSDAFGASPPPGGEIGHESVSRCGALCLLNDGGLHQRPEVPGYCLFLGVDRLREAAQKHRRSSDVLDLMGMTSSAAHRVTRMWRSVMRRVLRPRRWLALPPLS